VSIVPKFVKNILVILVPDLFWAVIPLSSIHTYKKLRACLIISTKFINNKRIGFLCQNKKED